MKGNAFSECNSSAAPHPDRGRRRVAALFLLLVLPLAAIAGASEVPTLTSIMVDGSMGDWGGVLSNPRNVTIDGNGSAQSCLTSFDRDCPISDPDLDLRRFAWTYDAQSLYLFFERYSPQTSNATPFYVFLDVDGDTLMNAGMDRVLNLALNPDSGEVGYSVRTHVPNSPAGDAMVDAAGYADGFAPLGFEPRAGTLIFQSAPYPAATGDGERFEIGIAWTELDLDQPTVLNFHAGSICCAFTGSPDNLGAPDGTLGTTGFHDVYVAPPAVGHFGPGAPIRYAHEIRNTGNLPDSFALRTVSEQGLEVALWSDPNGDGDPSDGVLLGSDRQGNGSYTEGGDQRPGDSDGDTFPDTPVLAPGESFSLVLEIVPGGGDRQFYEQTTLHVRSLGGSREAALVDETTVGDLTLTPVWDLSVEPGSDVALPQTIHNHLAEDVCADFRWISSLFWNYTLWSDPNGDGDPADGSPLTDTCGDAGQDLLVSAGGQAHFVARLSVQPDAVLGEVESLLLTATGATNGSPAANAEHTLTVADVFSLTPEYRLSDGTAKSGAAGHTLFLRHTLTNSGPQAEIFRIEVVPPAGHPVAVFTDPNGDGLPWDGAIVPNGDTVGPLAPFGGRLPLVLALEIAAGTDPGTQLDVAASATPDSSPGIARGIRDEIIVTHVAAYADALFFLQETTYPRCATIFARATGLVPDQSGRYRLRWVDETSSTSLRTSSVSSDGAGEATDILSLDSTSTSGPHTLHLEEWDGTQWLEIDRFGFEVAGPWQFDSITPDKPWYSPTGDDLIVVTRVENPGPAEVKTMILGHVVLDPSETQYLRGDGTFVPWNPGLWTRTAGPWDLSAGDARSSLLNVPGVVFPSLGTYTVRASAIDACGQELATMDVPILVSGDTDGDGWSDVEEARLGTDPTDSDTDDDGLPDPLDGSGDADGDGTVDALECDADGDGLRDSVEAGLDGSGLTPDTDLGAGCFQADGDAGLTRTDRLRADSDGGGEPDGREDLDLDGVPDLGEKDPQDATDDPCLLQKPREVSGLRVSRSGPDVRLDWSEPPGRGPCVSYRAWRAPDGGLDSFTSFSEVQSGTVETWWIHDGGAVEGTLSAWLVAADGRISGPGRLGHYLQ